MGSLEVGKSFDALVIECGSFQPYSSQRGSQQIPYDVYPDDTRLDRLEKFVQLGDDRNIKQVYVQGRQILASQ